MTRGRAALALAVLTGLTACADRRADGPMAASNPSPRVVIGSRRAGRLEVPVEIARTEAERERGLMFRRALPPDAGMLFVFDETGEHAFWMKNTLIPLDMIFIGDDGRVTGVVARATPGSLEPRSAGPSRFVLEVNGGWAEAHGVTAGDAVKFEGVPFP
ncbi:MAG TPA: DUF192 domain-containing protein [Anaeromyxobacteraceae bacterium]|nr:DUF192 domain-containing protein [Anaeromyxobacteraceae bacterium]